jgi:TrmH family RNA methyltransferase
VIRRLHISSSANDRVKRLRRVLRHGRRDGVFVAHGYRAIRRALDAGAPVRELYAAPELFLGDADAALVDAAGVPVTWLSPDVFRSLPGLPRPDGLLAVVERYPTPLDALPRNGLVVVAEAVERPGNLGTIVRTACGAGAAALVAADPRTDLFHPETVHASVGTIFELPVAASSTSEAIAWWEGRVVVATPNGRRAHWDADFRGATAIVVGNERVGVSDAWLARADETVRIPLPGPADSLNVAVAAGIVLFEALRSRERDGRLDLDREPGRQLRDADRRACAESALLAPQVDHQVAEPVDHRRLVGEAGRRPDEAEHLHPARDAVERSELVVEDAAHEERGVPRRDVRLVG